MGYKGNIGKSADMEIIGLIAPNNTIAVGKAIPIARNRVNNTRVEGNCECDVDFRFIEHQAGTEQIQLRRRGLYSISIVINGVGTAPMAWSISDNEGNDYVVAADIATGAVVGTRIVRSSEGRTTIRIVNVSAAPIAISQFTDPSIPQGSVAVTYLGK